MISEMVLYQASGYNLPLFKTIVHKPTTQGIITFVTSGRAKDHQSGPFLANWGRDAEHRERTDLPTEEGTNC